jgi:serine/threonine protein kinase
MSPEIKDFIDQCCRMNAADRPTAAELLNHPFLQKAAPFEELVPLVEKAKAEANKVFEMDGEEEEYW